MVCPKCGSNNIYFGPETTTTTQQQTKGYDGCNACCGFMLFGWYGLLCGLCGMGDTKTKTIHKTKMVKKCRDCGKIF